MRLLPENQVAVFEWLDRCSLDAVRFSSATFNSLVARHLAVYPLRQMNYLFLTRMSRPQSNILEYIINLSTDVAGRKIELRLVVMSLIYIYTKFHLKKIPI